LLDVFCAFTMQLKNSTVKKTSSLIYFISIAFVLDVNI
jgi:hypothetical protein